MYVVLSGLRVALKMGILFKVQSCCIAIWSGMRGSTKIAIFNLKVNPLTSSLLPYVLCMMGDGLICKGERFTA